MIGFHDVMPHGKFSSPFPSILFDVLKEINIYVIIEIKGLICECQNHRVELVKIF